MPIDNSIDLGIGYSEELLDSLRGICGSVICVYKGSKDQSNTLPLRFLF